MPEKEGEQFDPTMDLVVILQTTDRLKLAMARGLLEEAGIPYFVLGQIKTLMTDVDPFLHKGSSIQVPGDLAEEAREALEGLLHPETVTPLAEDSDQG